MSSLLLLFLPKLLRGTRDRWVAQVSFIIIHSTGLAPFPRLSAPPHSSHTPIAPRRPGGTHETALYSPPPPLPPLPGGARQGGRGVPGGKDRRGERKETEGWGVTETREGERELLNRGSPTPGHATIWSSASWMACVSDVGRWHWTHSAVRRGSRTMNCSSTTRSITPSTSRDSAMSHLRQASAGRVAWRRAGFLVPGFGTSVARFRDQGRRTRKSGVTSHKSLFNQTNRKSQNVNKAGCLFFCSSTTASGSHWRSPPLPAARSSQHRDPTQQRGLYDSVSLLPPGFRHQCNAVRIYGKKEAGTGEHLNILITK